MDPVPHPAVPTPAAAPRAAGRPLDSTDLALYAGTVFVWGTSWIAMRAQLGVVAPEVSLLWRMIIAAVVMLAYAAWTGERMRHTGRDHLWFAVSGLFLFSTNFLLFYYGGLTIPSGLLAVVFSLASVLNLVLGAVLLRQRVEPKVAAGGVVGVAGVGLLFWPQIAGAGFQREAILGLAFCVGGTVSFCLGNMVSTVIQRRGISVVAATTWGMAYGTALIALVCLLRGQAFIVEPTWRYLGALVYLAIPSSVVAFACYLTLLRRIGSARAGYATVLFPVVALLISTVAEDYRWTLAAVLGTGLALLGNVLVLRGRG